MRNPLAAYRPERAVLAGLGQRASSGWPSGRSSRAGGSSTAHAERRPPALGLAPLAGVSATIRVLIVDDDALVRSGLSMMLAGREDVRVVAEVADGDEVAAAVARATLPTSC